MTPDLSKLKEQVANAPSVSPDVVLAMIEKLELATVTLERYREALEFYAGTRTITLPVSKFNPTGELKQVLSNTDGGKCARQVLSFADGMEEGKK